MNFDPWNYHSAMDRGYKPMEREGPLGEVPIKDIGVSTNPMQNQLEALKARIFQGASHVELGFTGTGKGSMGGQSTNPEMYGMDERRDIKEMADINKVNLSVHASFSIPPMSGFDPRQGVFREEAQEGALREIERAIDFAADTTRGGAVVVHTGEFGRALSEEEWAMRRDKDGNVMKDATGKPQWMFKTHPREDQEAMIQFVDKQTGQIQRITKNMGMRLPKWVGEDDKGNIPTDEKKTPISDMGWPMPRYEDGKFVTEPMTWDRLEKLTQWYNEKNPDKPMSPAKVLLKFHNDMGTQSSMAYIKQYEEPLRIYTDLLQDAQEAKNDPSKTPRLMDNWARNQENAQELMQMNSEQRREAYISQISRFKDQVERFRGPVLSYQQQREARDDQFKRTVDIEDYALERTAETIARAAEFAHRETVEKKLPNPLYISPENIFPESYGAHPQELKKIIGDARKKFVDQYSPRYGAAEAKKLSEEHIKATFDIGHAYLWRKYYQEDPKKSFEANEKDFQDWLPKEIEDLNKGKYIGHVHVSDNFGWEDEHVTPGQGRVPIKEFMERMKAAGVTEITTEPAHQDFKAMLGLWREIGGPVYAHRDMTRQRWTDIEHSYFGRTKTPYFIFGEYAPSNEYTLWSQTPLE